MKKARPHRPLRKSVSLAASFVVTVGATATATAGCKKSTVEGPNQGSSVSIFKRDDGTCHLSYNVQCPKDVMCNPPAPQQIDCPPDMRDAGDPATPEITRRPPGKENWLRIPSKLWVGNDGCSFIPEGFCAPPKHPNAGQCTSRETLKVTCEGPDAGGVQATTRKVDSFIYKDGTGQCRKVPATECKKSRFGDGCPIPDGEPTPCP